MTDKSIGGNTFGPEDRIVKAVLDGKRYTALIGYGVRLLRIDTVQIDPEVIDPLLCFGTSRFIVNTDFPDTVSEGAASDMALRTIKAIGNGKYGQDITPEEYHIFLRRFLSTIVGASVGELRRGQSLVFESCNTTPYTTTSGYDISAISATVFSPSISPSVAIPVTIINGIPIGGVSDHTINATYGPFNPAPVGSTYSYSDTFSLRTTVPSVPIVVDYAAGGPCVSVYYDVTQSAFRAVYLTKTPSFRMATQPRHTTVTAHFSYITESSGVYTTHDVVDTASIRADLPCLEGTYTGIVASSYLSDRHILPLLARSVPYDNSRFQPVDTPRTSLLTVTLDISTYSPTTASVSGVATVACNGVEAQTTCSYSVVDGSLSVDPIVSTAAMALGSIVLDHIQYAVSELPISHILERRKLSLQGTTIGIATKFFLLVPDGITCYAVWYDQKVAQNNEGKIGTYTAHPYPLDSSAAIVASTDIPDSMVCRSALVQLRKHYTAFGLDTSAVPTAPAFYYTTHFPIMSDSYLFTDNYREERAYAGVGSSSGTGLPSIAWAYTQSSAYSDSARYRLEGDLLEVGALIGAPIWCGTFGKTTDIDFRDGTVRPTPTSGEGYSYTYTQTYPITQPTGLVGYYLNATTRRIIGPYEDIQVALEDSSFSDFTWRESYGEIYKGHISYTYENLGVTAACLVSPLGVFDIALPAISYHGSGEEIHREYFYVDRLYTLYPRYSLIGDTFPKANATNVSVATTVDTTVKQYGRYFISIDRHSGHAIAQCTGSATAGVSASVLGHELSQASISSATGTLAFFGAPGICLVPGCCLASKDKIEEYTTSPVGSPTATVRPFVWSTSLWSALDLVLDSDSVKTLTSTTFIVSIGRSTVSQWDNPLRYSLDEAPGFPEGQWLTGLTLLRMPVLISVYEAGSNRLLEDRRYIGIVSCYYSNLSTIGGHPVSFSLNAKTYGVSAVYARVFIVSYTITEGPTSSIFGPEGYTYTVRRYTDTPIVGQLCREDNPLLFGGSPTLPASSNTSSWDIQTRGRGTNPGNYYSLSRDSGVAYLPDNLGLLNLIERPATYSLTDGKRRYPKMLHSLLVGNSGHAAYSYGDIGASLVGIDFLRLNDYILLAYTQDESAFTASELYAAILEDPIEPLSDTIVVNLRSSPYYRVIYILRWYARSAGDTMASLLVDTISALEAMYRNNVESLTSTEVERILGDMYLRALALFLSDTKILYNDFASVELLFNISRLFGDGACLLPVEAPDSSFAITSSIVSIAVS